MTNGMEAMADVGYGRKRGCIPSYLSKGGNCPGAQRKSLVCYRALVSYMYCPFILWWDTLSNFVNYLLRKD